MISMVNFQQQFFQLFDNIKNNLLNTINDFMQHSPQASPLYVMLIFLAMLLVLHIIKKRKVAKINAKNTFNHKDVESIAGDNIIATQLDLARAYIEMGKNNLAKNMLYQIKKQGTVEQKQQAKKLLESL